MKRFYSALALAVFSVTQAVASTTVIDELTGYYPGAASEAIVGGSEITSLFAINGNLHIDALRWAGMIGREDVGAGSAPLDFVVRIYNDAASGPNSLLIEQQVAPTFVQEAVFDDLPESYSEAGVFSSNVSIDLAPGKYWISMSAKLNQSAKWYGAAFEPYTLSGITGSGGALKIDGSSPWEPMNEGVSFYDGRGNAFAIEGTISSAPEPETYAMLMIGLGLVQVVRRSRRKPAHAVNQAV